VFGKKYVPLTKVQSFQQRGVATGTASAPRPEDFQRETYDMYAMSAAHPTLPIPSYARVKAVKTAKR